MATRLRPSSVSSANQAFAHTQPPDPSEKRGKGRERPLFSPALRPPAGFGELSTIYDQPRGATAKDGVHSFIFAPPRTAGASTGDSNGIDRTESDTYAFRLNDPLCHPTYKTYYNYEGRTFKQLTALEKRVLEMSVHYPDIQNGIMRAPLYFRTQNFTQPEVEQPEIVRRVFATPEMFNQIAGYLIPRYEDLANLCRTCQLTARMVQRLWMHLDAANNDFSHWDKYCLLDIRKVEALGEATLEKMGKKLLTHAYFSPSVLISPIRPLDQGPVREMAVNKAGYPIGSTVDKWEGTDYTNSIKAHYQLLHMVYLNGYAIKHLILHGLPWVNVEALKRIVPEMPKLEVLGVHQCFLLTLGDTQPILHAINDINKERAKLRQPHVAVDYSPYYYKGPPYKEDGTGHIGEYGVVPEEQHWLATTRAVAAQMFGIWRLCLEGNQDFFTAGTGFRSYLNRLPIRTLPSIIECIAAIYDYTAGKYHSSVGTHSRRYTRPVSEDLKQAMEFTLWARLIVSCEGRPMLKEALEKLLLVFGKFHLEHCTICGSDMAGYFFTADALRCQVQDTRCYGCELGLYLCHHTYRLNSARREEAQRIFRRKNDKELSLRKVLRNIAKPARAERPAILSRPGMVDTRFLGAAEKLRDELTVLIPDRLRETILAMKIVDERFDDPCYDDEELLKLKKKLERRRLAFEFQLGTNQRIPNEGALEVHCRSWERNIRDYRAELALERGLFTNRGPMRVLYNLESNVADMLGDSGGFPAYWDFEPDEELDEKESIADIPQAPRTTTPSSPPTETPAPKPLATRDSPENPPTVSKNVSSRTSRPSGVYIPPHKRSMEAAEKPTPALLPHQRTGKAAEDKPTPSLLPHQRTITVVEEKLTPGLLPHQRTSKVAEEEPTTSFLPHQRTIQAAERPRPGLLPHQRTGKAAEEKQTPSPLLPHQRTMTVAEEKPTPGLLPHQRTSKVAEEEPTTSLLPHQRTIQIAERPTPGLLPHQRRPPGNIASPTYQSTPPRTKVVGRQQEVSLLSSGYLRGRAGLFL
ncbi:hypothetical protein F5Y14DRAFT_458183 [Nemania sp. NC0429]|nr:hypothetical protein F5Y14DRAFT_458183 [Nemania sp. NC0429]